MNPRYQKLKKLLEELFQLDQPDLDFGIYRIMHAKSAEVSSFLEKDLLPQIKSELSRYQSADKDGLKKELAAAVNQANELGVDPEQTQKVKALRERLATEAVDLGQLEAEIYDHLYAFFRRYYSEGDFLSKRVYKEGVYAIPYQGEEVLLHWANKDQYYIKTSEYLRDYAFRLNPKDAKKLMRVHFRLRDAAEGEHGNVREAEGKARVFVLAEEEPLSLERTEEGEEELVVFFEYRPARLEDWPEDQRADKKRPPAQKDLIDFAAKRVLGDKGRPFAPWIDRLGKPHVKADGESAEYSRLEAHLRRYTARNTFDYFIHKDLGAFLRLELDFFIKNEVMHLDDVENESAPRLEQILSKIKVVRRIASKIIDFLAQLEDFQKKLWLKKKFVTETSYCVRLGIIPKAFFPEIAKNQAQHDEWVALHAIDEIEGDLASAGYSQPLSPAFLEAHPTLMVDTRHFDEDFTARLLESFGDLDEQTDGVLFHSENFQALSLMQARYREQVKCIYIDPPYNTGGDGFAYRDSYQHSSWLSMISDRMSVAQSLLLPTAATFISLDDTEHARLRLSLESILPAQEFLANIIWKKRSSPDARATIGSVHDNILCYINSPKTPKQCIGKMRLSTSRLASYKNPDNDSRGRWASADMTAMIARATDEQFYEILLPSGRKLLPPDGRSWGLAKATFEALRKDDRIWFGEDGDNVPRVKKFLSEVDGQTVPTFWDMPDVGSNDEGNKQISDLFGNSSAFQSPKPCRLISRIVDLTSSSLTLDFFGGSGTTAHAVIDAKREDGSERKFILVEMGAHFDRVLLPRLKKAVFTPEWREGKPTRLATTEEAQRSPRVFKVIRTESYEDTLNNLELKRSDAQQALFDSFAAQGDDAFGEEYLLRYMLEVESRGSPSLLNIQSFAEPTAYKLLTKRPGSDESQEVCVDLLETFNWLLGLQVSHIAAPQVFHIDDGAFTRDSEGRLRLKGALIPDPDGLFWFRTVEGVLRDGRRVLVIWRMLSGVPEEDNLVLDEWFQKQGYSSKDSEFDLIYVNGDNNLENLKTPDDRWKVRLIEEDFHRLMFETEGF